MFAYISAPTTCHVTPPPEICAKLDCLIEAVRAKNKHCKIAFSPIIIRPRDENTMQYFYQQGDATLATKRRESNDLIKLMLRSKGADMLRTWECLMMGSLANQTMYYRDGLHLSDLGVSRMIQYIINNLGRLLR